MREYIQTNKSKIIRVIILLVVFFFIVAYFHGKSVYNQKVKMLQAQQRIG